MACYDNITSPVSAAITYSKIDTQYLSLSAFYWSVLSLLPIMHVSTVLMNSPRGNWNRPCVHTALRYIQMISCRWWPFLSTPAVYCVGVRHPLAPHLPCGGRVVSEPASQGHCVLLEEEILCISVYKLRRPVYENTLYIKCEMLSVFKITSANKTWTVASVLACSTIFGSMVCKFASRLFQSQNSWIKSLLAPAFYESRTNWPWRKSLYLK